MQNDRNFEVDRLKDRVDALWNHHTRVCVLEYLQAIIAIAGIVTMTLTILLMGD